MPFDSHLTAVRPPYDHSTNCVTTVVTCCGLVPWGVTVASRSVTLMNFGKHSNGRRIEVDSKSSRSQIDCQSKTVELKWNRSCNRRINRPQLTDGTGYLRCSRSLYIQVCLSIDVCIHVSRIALKKDVFLSGCQERHYGLSNFFWGPDIICSDHRQIDLLCSHCCCPSIWFAPMSLEGRIVESSDLVPRCTCNWQHCFEQKGQKARSQGHNAQDKRKGGVTWRIDSH